MKGSPFGTEFDPVNTEPVDRPQARPSTGDARSEADTRTSCSSVHVRMPRGAVPQEQDSGSRLTMTCAGRECCMELLRAAEGRDRIDKDEEMMRRDKKR